MRLLRKRRERARSQSTEVHTISTEDAHLFWYLRHNVLPTPAQVHDQYVPSRLIGLQGIEINEKEQLARLEKWRGQNHQKLFETLRNDEKINCSFNGTSYLGSTCLHNGWYPTPDAEIYASMIYDFRPDKIVEVGSGFSTLIARRAIQYAGLKSSLTVIDPSPRTDVEQTADRVIYERVEDTKLDQFALTKNSLLFIDSSHVTRARGDVPYLFLEVLPHLPSGTVVHIHDIFIPYDYPTTYDQTCWTEQYVLQAMLANSTRYRTLFATQYMSRHRTAQMQQTFGPQVGSDNLFFGASYWLQVR